MAAVTGTLSGARKAALLLVQLGTERAGRILSVLDEAEIEAVIAEVTRLEDVDGALVDAVLTELVSHLDRSVAPNGTGPTFARKALDSGLGAERAKELIGRVSSASFEELTRLPVDQAVAVLSHEHPQAVAVILSRIDPEVGLRLFQEMPSERQADLAFRMASMEPPSPAVLAAVESGLARRIAATGPAPARSGRSDRAGAVVELLARVDADTESAVLDRIGELDAELAKAIRLKLFSFEDLTRLDDKAMQLLVRGVDPKVLALALKGAGDGVREKIFANMSERSAANVTEEIDLLGPQRKADVDAARMEVLGAMRALEADGKITIARGDDSLVA